MVTNRYGIHVAYDDVMSHASLHTCDILTSRSHEGKREWREVARKGEGDIYGEKERERD